jgi:hypothetical protein
VALDSLEPTANGASSSPDGGASIGCQVRVEPALTSIQCVGTHPSGVPGYSEVPRVPCMHRWSGTPLPLDTTIFNLLRSIFFFSVTPFRGEPTAPDTHPSRSPGLGRRREVARLAATHESRRARTLKYHETPMPLHDSQTVTLENDLCDTSALSIIQPFNHSSTISKFRRSLEPRAPRFVTNAPTSKRSTSDSFALLIWIGT